MKALLCTLGLAGTISAVAMSTVAAQTGAATASMPTASQEAETAVSNTLARAKDALRRAFLKANDAPEALETAREENRAVVEQQHALAQRAQAVQDQQRALQHDERAIHQMREQAQRELERAQRDIHRADETLTRERVAEERARQKWAESVERNAQSIGRNAKAMESEQSQLADAMLREGQIQERAAMSLARIHESRGHDGHSQDSDVADRLRELEKELARLSKELHRAESKGEEAKGPRGLHQLFEVRAPREAREPREPREPRAPLAPLAPRQPRAPRELREPREPREPRAPRTLLFGRSSSDDCEDQCDEDESCDAPRFEGKKILRFNTNGKKLRFEGHDSPNGSGHRDSKDVIANGKHIIWSDGENSGSCNYSVDVNSNGVTVFQVNGNSEPKVIYRHRGTGDDGATHWAVPDSDVSVSAPRVFQVEIPELADMPDIDFPDIEMMNIDMEDFEFPDFEMIEIDMEDFDFPEFEAIEIDMEDFKFPEHEMIEIEAPLVRILAPRRTRVETTVETRPDVALPPGQPSSDTQRLPLAVVRAAHPGPVPALTPALAFDARSESELLEELIGLMHGLKGDMGSLQADIRALHAEIESTEPH